MHSPGQGLAVQGRGAQAAALADALASLRRTRARMASLTAYGTAGGRASHVGRASGSRHPGKLQGSTMSAGLPGREPNPGAKACTTAAQGGCLETGKEVSANSVQGTPKGSHWGALGLQKNSTRSGVLTRDSGCQVLFRVLALDLGNMDSVRGCHVPV